jgi:AcrR family transcriptional regulator
MTAEEGRKYDSPRRREQARATRQEIAEAARRLFAERGWAATTVRDIARAARVSEPTVYNSYGGKAGIAIALVDAVDLGADVPRELAELAAADGDPARQIGAMVAFDRRLLERGGDVIAMMREAGRVEPDLAAAYREGRRRGRQTQHRVFSSWPAGALREGVDVDAACEAYAGLCNIDTYRTLTEEQGWSPERVERWWRESLAQLLLR